MNPRSKEICNLQDNIHQITYKGDILKPDRYIQIDARSMKFDLKTENITLQTDKRMNVR